MPDQYPNNQPTNLYNAAITAGGCTDPGLCPVYPQNVGFGCGKTVTDLEGVAKAADDPTRIFHKTQTCIARRSCDLRCQMGNCKWMDRVIPNFVLPYLQKAGGWQGVEADCALPPTLPSQLGVRVRDRMCARAMAKYHIEVDLDAALSASGCGSDLDWSTVFDTIQAYTTETFNSAPYLPLSDLIAGLAVHSYREDARSRCQAARLAAGKPLEIEADLGGKQCFQQ